MVFFVQRAKERENGMRGLGKVPFARMKRFDNKRSEGKGFFCIDREFINVQSKEGHRGGAMGRIGRIGTVCMSA